jgi:protoporphyrinogen oxidase
MILGLANLAAEHQSPRGAGDVIILGAGLAGLTAGNLLSRSGFKTVVIEKDSVVGGLARTFEHRGFRFDLGGHRFYTRNERIDALVRDALGGDVLDVERSSKILLGGRYFDYPWRPLNAIRGFGVRGAAAIISDYAVERLRHCVREPEVASFEDVIVNRFGRAMFEIFVKEYSEKVWGVECRHIAAELANWRIQNLSVGAAIRDALFPRGRGAVRSLARKFLYPPLGIGQIAAGLKRRIEESNRVLTGATVTGVHHSGGRVDGITVFEDDRTDRHRADNFVSSIPLDRLVHLLDPRPPDDILAAADRLRFRDLVIVTVMIDRDRVTDQSWIYLPERKIPFGRIHEPTNWSVQMAPEGKTLLVTEHFCFRGDDVWNADDDALAGTTIASLESLGLIRGREVIDGMVVRVPDAYPIFEVGHDENRRKICDYIDGFGNLRVIGRGGMFRYYNMDHAMESGIAAAEEITAGYASAGAHGGHERAVAEPCR